jgi:hypothetical protein
MSCRFHLRHTDRSCSRWLAQQAQLKKAAAVVVEMESV